jgi:predicted lipoprotein with Yx(FWY)xxD motif
VVELGPGAVKGSRRHPHCRRSRLVAIVTVLASAVAGCGGASHSAKQAAPSLDPTVAVNAIYMARFHAKVLVDGAGYSLYVFGPDHRRSVACTATCALSWPPLTIPAASKPSIGAGVEAGLVGVMALAGGTDVVTYAGWPLYTYVADVSPGMATGEGINLNGGPWDLMRPDGSPLVPAGQPLLQGADVRYTPGL